MVHELVLPEYSAEPSSQRLTLKDTLVVGEHCNLRRRCAVRHAGVVTKENVGISNDNGGEKPPHRKTKVSSAMLIS